MKPINSFLGDSPLFFYFIFSMEWLLQLSARCEYAFFHGASGFAHRAGAFAHRANAFSLRANAFSQGANAFGHRANAFFHEAGAFVRQAKGFFLCPSGFSQRESIFFHRKNRAVPGFAYRASGFIHVGQSEKIECRCWHPTKLQSNL